MHAFVFGSVASNNVRMLCDTGAFCCCVSLEFYNKQLRGIAPLDPTKGSTKFTAANSSPLFVAGSVKLPIKLGGCTITLPFQVIDRLSQDIILGVPFMEYTGAVIDYRRKRLALFDDTVIVPLVTSVDPATAIKTIRPIRIPARHEVIIPVCVPPNPHSQVGISETLPQTAREGLRVASALIDGSKGTSLCRLINRPPEGFLGPRGTRLPILILSPVTTWASS